MKKMGKMSPWLPELVADILLRLPVSSLLRFRCLSRSLCTKIDSENFVKNHLNRSIQTTTRQKLVIHFLFNNCNDFYIADFDDDLADAFLLNKPLISPHHASLVYGYCNGLILLGRDLAVWNPFTRRYKKLPPCPVETLPGYTRFMCSGLGYDSAHDDYMIVLISEIYDSNRVFYQVWIFGLKSDFWRRSRDLNDDVSPWGVGHFASGALYWACKIKNKCVGFDLAKEAFFDIPLPSDCGPASTFWDSLVVFRGNVYCPTFHNGTVEYYLLVSEDKGGDVVEVSWRKEFTMENVKTIMENVFPPWPLTYSKDRNSILLGEIGGVFWHNLENRAKQRVNIAGQPEVRGCRYNVCSENLVSVGKDSAFDGAAEEVTI